MKEKSSDIDQSGKQPTEIRRLHLKIQGAVQGVGFRPFIYRTATRLGLSGWVNNSARGVEIDLEGHTESLNQFLDSLENDSPPHSIIESRKVSYHEPRSQVGFSIIESDDSGDISVLILPDIATCPDCLKEIFDPGDRRYMYPFTNCTNCGPRYSIIESLPYDRANTTMKSFQMCEDCLAEYENPLNRRFHAQPNACPNCGPHLELWDKRGNLIASHYEALTRACEAVKGGEILALKGLGGFHLIVNAQNSQAVKRLRYKKGRKEKPFALMYPNLESIEMDCEVSELERNLLRSAEAPIVLLRSKRLGESNDPCVYKYIAPDNPYLGIMLPYTPLHHLLLANLDFPIVTTSGNLSEEPICIDEHEALGCLGQIADLFLIHNRPITRHLDDSIVRIMSGRELILRRARGYAPLPIRVENMLDTCLAVGGHQKNSLAIGFDKHIFISQHIGDLESKKAFDTFIKTGQSLTHLYDMNPSKVICDKHPDYLSVKYARDLGIPLQEVQHHYAHVLSCMAENQLSGTVLGVAWDGSGYGSDGTVWGGEFLVADTQSFERFAHLRTFTLPGNERAVMEPRRSALGLLYEMFGAELFNMSDLRPLRAFSSSEIAILQNSLKKKINTPLTSSAGRLFDAVCSLLGLCQTTSFEGQAAMRLEFEAEVGECDESYNFRFEKRSEVYIIDWEPMIRAILDDMGHRKTVGHIAAKAHNTIAEMMAKTAGQAGIRDVVLSGGCFQNKYLTERTINLLRSIGLKPYWHRYVPPNDGGLALGQALAGVRSKPEN